MADMMAGGSRKDRSQYDFKWYLDHTKGVPGWFAPDAMIAWDFLLSAQNKMNISGHFLEIGVFEGKSAILGAMYLEPREKAVLIDLYLRDAALQRIREVKPDNLEPVSGASSSAVHSPLVQGLVRQYRFIHIDGDHSGYSVAADLAFAAQAIKEEGIICMDDFFNPAYPQVTAAIYKFLFDNEMSFRMVLCGKHKCFIVKASQYRRYENLIRAHFLNHLAAYESDSGLYKTSYVHDYGCFAIHEKHEPDRRLYGPDLNKADIVF
jgi:hypothetical protein